LPTPDAPDTQRLRTPIPGANADGLKQALARPWEHT
jgi:hypothetical protein